ncbi:hypothetical protein [Sporohalobacter salinus]|uniref:hypothetical protein n=1 Tax=Sporohalobacter salinus TaxID=1494606 RepID=UPI0019611A76|nr:hypothetical protein [Sporohalobacter salinus]MBM7623169.1 hypothetical protein [Sporohalobacter salinus]
MENDNKIIGLLVRLTNSSENKPVNERQMLNETNYLLKGKSAKKIHDFLEKNK